MYGRGKIYRMKIRAILSVIAMLVVGAHVSAAPSSYVAWTAETVRLVSAGDASKGAVLAYGCAACHGESGLGVSPDFPHIAGQDPRYLFKQLSDFRDKTRTNPVMNGIAAGMTDQEMADIAAYYAAQPGPPPESPGAESVTVPALVTRGNGSRMVPACQGCHGDNGAGSPGYYGMAVLAGQKSSYLQGALKQFRDGSRSNDIYSVMRAIAKPLTDDEIAALGDYYAAQHLR
jgi:cytochrome c553